MPIKILPPQLACQIAAGEVIERPASVLKELLENSLDADSQHIEVRILRSGIQQIYVQDDGKGIPVDDFPLVFSPHATSKIATLMDLENLQSLGFRGEALASIASVAKVTLTARDTEANTGHRLLADFNSPTPTIIPVPCEVGTTIDVQDLFYNTPARRKFLKSDKTEWLHIEETFKRAALSSPTVAFSLLHHNKVIYRLPACEDKNRHLTRIKQFTGKFFVEQAIELSAELEALKLWGWIAPPMLNPIEQKNGLVHYFFLNGRVIRDKVITHALQQAFLSLFPTVTHTQMAYVLYFELPSEQVDINVHPAKQEVRFREPRRVHGFLAQTVEAAFKQEPSVQEGTMQGTVQSAAAMHASSTDIKQSNTTLGTPLCVIRHRWLLTDNQENLLLIDLIHAHMLLQLSLPDLTFFSMKESSVLIQQLEKQGHMEWPVLTL